MSVSTDLDEATAASEFREELARRLAIGRMPILACLGFAAFFLVLSYMPLFYSDLWGHVAYGQWIIEHRTLPTEDPFLELAAGVDTVCTAWLGQVLLASLESWGGPAAISVGYAVTVALTYLVLAIAFRKQTLSLGLALFGTALVLGLASTRFGVVRTEMFGMLAFALLVLNVILVRKSLATAATTSTRWLHSAAAIPIFLLWANLHGSFVVGLATLACLFVGRALSVLWSERSIKPLLADPEVRTWLVMTECGVFASLVNPYGMDLFVHSLVFPANPNLVDVLEWFPLEFQFHEGIAMVASWVGVAALLRWSDRPIRPAEILLIALFSFLTIDSIRMIGWYAVIYGYCTLPHVAAVLARIRRRRGTPTAAPRPHRSPVNFAICAVVTWIAFSFSPASIPLLGGTPRPMSQVLHSETPVELTKFLHQFDPQGQVFNPQWWGDWLAWQGPDSMPLFMTTNAVHLAPQRVWKDYMKISTQQSGWKDTLDKYRIQTVVIHKSKQEGLDAAIRVLPGWRVVYEDDLGLVATREPKRPFEDAPAPNQSNTDGPHIGSAQ